MLLSRIPRRSRDHLGLIAAFEALRLARLPRQEDSA